MQSAAFSTSIGGGIIWEMLYFYNMGRITEVSRSKKNA